MKPTLTLIALLAASPALAHGDTPIHGASALPLIAGGALLVLALALALRRAT